MTFDSVALVWFRRDLRSTDHAALHAALGAHGAVHCAFVFDTEILEALPTRSDRRVEFIWESVRELKAALEARGGGLHVLHGRARMQIPRLARDLGAAAVYANRDYEPAAVARDEYVARELQRLGIAWRTRKDQVIFEREEVRTRAGGDFTVFTPYKRAWLAKLAPYYLKPYPVDKHALRLARSGSGRLPSLEAIGFARTNLAELAIPTGMTGAARLFAEFKRRIDRYHERRDYPALKGPSYMSLHLRFGTVSVREIAGHAWRRATPGAQAWLSELIWRDFYFMILASRPDVVGHAFRREYDALRFDDDQAHWRAWCAGVTGYPLVDAAMRQLEHTGYMHNRLRMVTASFLVKDLGIDWRRGERWFAAKLNDYDLAANNGGWQWAASTGCDAQPWFRVFNPVTQSLKFDPQGEFIRRYVTELARVPPRFVHAPWSMKIDQQRAHGCVIGKDYPAPIVDHAAARTRTLQRFAAIKPNRSFSGR
jgi:deoxyribodipyrimidine photo-lyase